MANMHLVTGYAGEAHVTASDVGALNAAIFGNGQYVLNYGNKLSASFAANNLVRVLDGILLMQGRQIRITSGNYVDLKIDNGATGYYRNDLIVARYTKASSTGVESANLVVIKGTPATTAAAVSDPDFVRGDIATGAAQHDMPLYRVRIENLAMVELVPLFETVDSLADHLADTDNPHKVTTIQVGTSEANHTHALSSMTGTLPVNKGGTGATTKSAALNNLGAASANHSHTLDSLSNVHVSSFRPSSVVNGHWYLVRES